MSADAKGEGPMSADEIEVESVATAMFVLICAGLFIAGVAVGHWLW
jgi:hypothetical protein